MLKGLAQLDIIGYYGDSPNYLGSISPHLALMVNTSVIQYIL